MIVIDDLTFRFRASDKEEARTSRMLLPYK